MISALDVSQWQGNIDWKAVKADGYDIAILKMSGGDAGLYTDANANANYYGAKAAGLLVAGYHFAGGGNPENEADFFLACMSPLEADDVLILDWEINHATPVEWCRRFIQRLKDRNAPIPLLYINNYTENALDWTPVVQQNVALWLANYGLSYNDDAVLKHFASYIMHQYTSSGRVSGVAGNVDLDKWFASAEQFKAYGYHTAPISAPEPTPVPTPQPETTPVPTPVPVPDNSPPPVADPAPAVLDSPLDKENNALLKEILKLLKSVWGSLSSLHKKVNKL